MIQICHTKVRWACSKIAAVRKNKSSNGISVLRRKQLDRAIKMYANEKIMQIMSKISNKWRLSDITGSWYILDGETIYPSFVVRFSFFEWWKPFVKNATLSSAISSLIKVNGMSINTYLSEFDMNHLLFVKMMKTIGWFLSFVFINRRQLFAKKSHISIDTQ